jgi:hypothetical protein
VALVGGAPAANGAAGGAGVVPGVPMRPTVLVRLLLRLEEFSNDDGDASLPDDAPPPDKRAGLQAALAKARARVADARASGTPDLETEALLVRVEAQLAGRRQAASGAAPESVARDEHTIVLYVVPTNYELELKTFLEADRFTCSFPLRDMPILPELVRSLLVDVFLGTVPASDFADAELWAPRPGRDPIQFRGYADALTLEAGDDFVVTLSVFSLEQVLMDKEINPLTKSRRVQGGSEKITSFLKRFFTTIPEFSGALGGDPIDVRLYPNVDPAKEPSLDRKLLTRVLQTAESRAQAAGGNVLPETQGPGQDPAGMLGQGTPTVPSPPQGTKLRAWDVVVRAAELVGLVPAYDPTVDPNSILLMPPQNLYDPPSGGVAVAGGPRDGFDRQFVEGGTTPVRSQVRLFCWGRNVGKLRMERRFGRNKPRAVQVVSYNPDARGKNKVLVARFPKTPRGVSASAVGTRTQVGGSRGHQPVDEITTVVILGLRDQGAAEQAAVSLFHAMSKRELRCSIETEDLMSYVDPAYPVDPNTPDGADLLRLRPGTPVRIVVARQQTDPTQGLVVNTLSEVFERRFNPAFLRRMLAEGRSRAGQFRDSTDFEVLETYLKRLEDAYQTARLTDWFYVKTVVHRGGSGDGEGYACRIEVFNYVEARNNPVHLSAGDAAANDARKEVRPRTREERQKAVNDEVVLEALMDNALVRGDR